MHRALFLLYAEAGRKGRLALLPPAPTFSPCPETALAAAGADDALRVLVHRGLLHETGRGLDAALTVDTAELVAARRALMETDPRVVALLQRAGERWAAFASTVANTSATATESVASTVASATA